MNAFNPKIKETVKQTQRFASFRDNKDNCEFGSTYFNTCSNSMTIPMMSLSISNLMEGSIVENIGARGLFFYRKEKVMLACIYKSHCALQ